MGAPLTRPRTGAVPSPVTVTERSLTGRGSGPQAAEAQASGLPGRTNPEPPARTALRSQLPGTGPLGWICASCEGQAPGPAQGSGLGVGMPADPGVLWGRPQKSRARLLWYLHIHRALGEDQPSDGIGPLHRAGHHPAFPSPQWLEADRPFLRGSQYRSCRHSRAAGPRSQNGLSGGPETASPQPPSGPQPQLFSFRHAHLYASLEK